MATEKQIEKLAYSIWEQEGRPEGKHEEHYFRAKQILEQQEATRVVELAPPPPIREIATPPPTIELALPLRRRRSFTRHKRRY
jgi:hypothetical protein